MNVSQTLQAIADAMVKNHQIWNGMAKAWQTTSGWTPGMFVPDAFVARLCGARKKRNRNLGCVPRGPGQIVLVNRGEYFVGGGELRIYRENGKLVEEQDFFSVSKKTAMRVLEEREEKDFVNLVSSVGQQLQFDI